MLEMARSAMERISSSRRPPWVLLSKASPGRKCGLRDEMANVAWAVERWRKVLGGRLTETIGGTSVAIRWQHRRRPWYPVNAPVFEYRWQPVPENWHPLVPAAVPQAVASIPVDRARLTAATDPPGAVSAPASSVPRCQMKRNCPDRQ
jgi:hypothetical protein